MTQTNFAGGVLTALRRSGERPALVGPRAISADTLADAVEGYAWTLHQTGVKAGTSVALSARPNNTSVAVLLALAKLGACTVLFDPRGGADTALSRLRAAQPEFLLADAAVWCASGWAAPLARRRGLDLPALSRVARRFTVGARWPGCPPRLLPGLGSSPTFGDDGDALVIFTSGTTDAPKGVVHSFASLAAGIHAAGRLVRADPNTCIVGEQFFVMAPALLAGATVIRPGRSASQIQRILTRRRPDLTYLTPPQLREQLRRETPLTGTVITGSAPASARLLGQAIGAGASRAISVYALTEAFPVAAVDAEAKVAFENAGGRGDLLGHPVDGISTSVDNSGQLLVSGPNVSPRYLGAAPTDEVATGDLVDIGEHGLVLRGRSKDMILRRAENIYPGLYENSLHQPGVALAVLVGVAQADGDERVVACIELESDATESAVRSRLREPMQRMGFASPDAVVFMSVPCQGRSRKPNRLLASRQAAERLGWEVST